MPDDIKEQEVQATEPTEVEVQPEADAQPEEQQEGLPEDASERTKREFEKLKKRNEELSKKLEEKEAGMPPKPSLLDSYMPQISQQAPQMPQAAQVAPNLTQAKVEEITKQLWDEAGTIDGQELERRLSLAQQAEARAVQAERKAQSALERVARFEADGVKKRLYESYPELDPDNKAGFNEEAYDLVRNELVNQLWQRGQQDPLAAAEKMSKYWKPKELKQTEAQKARQAVTRKSVSGTASSVASAEYEDLRKASLRSKDAMEERIRRAGI